MQSCCILFLTMTAIEKRLAASISTLIRLLPMGSMIASAIMQTPVTMRNIRSFRLTLWSKMSSIHFLNTRFSSCFYYNAAILWQTSSYLLSSAA